MSLTRTSVGGNTTIQTGADDDSVSVTHSVVTGTFKADGGLGSDTFTDGCGNSFLAGSTVVNFETQFTAVVDQQQLVAETPFSAAIGGGSEQKLAQVVTAGVTGLLQEVRLELGASDGDLIVEIKDVTGGIPNGTVLASQAIAAVALPNGCCFPPFESIIFSTPIPLTAGTQFAIVLRSTGTAATLPGPVGNPYSGGDAFFDSRPNPPGWVSISVGTDRFDLPFETCMLVLA